MLTYTSVGIFNNCNCWTKWFPDHAGSQRYLSFPQEQLVFDTIKRRLNYEFAIVTTVALGIELLIFFLVWVYFRRGHRVLKQRDMEDFLKRLDMEDVCSKQGWFKRAWKNCKGLFARKEDKTNGRDKNHHNRSRNSSVQSRQDTNTLEMQLRSAQ